MRGFVPFILAVALTSGPAVVAYAQAAGGQAPAASAASEADKQICKKEKETGSRLAAKKVCRTKAEWDEFYRQQRAETEQMQRNDMANKTPK
jgi:hypothetical protein